MAVSKLKRRRKHRLFDLQLGLEQFISETEDSPGRQGPLTQGAVLVSKFIVNSIYWLER